MESNQMRKVHQKGFIQGAILVGLALLVMVVAGFSLANRSSSASTDKEQIRMNAAIIVNSMQKMKKYINDAHYDGAFDNETRSDLYYTYMEPYVDYVSTVPILPDGAGSVPVSQVPRIGGYNWDPRWFRVKFSFLGAKSEHYGTEKGYEIVSKIGVINKETCAAINKIAFGPEHIYAKEDSLPMLSFSGAEWSSTWQVGDSGIAISRKPHTFCSATPWGSTFGFVIGVAR